MKNCPRYFAVVLITVVVILPYVTPSYSNAASSSNFSSADSAINSAFVATYKAGNTGANITSLVGKLNVAITLVQKAQTENSSNPSQATADLVNATNTANQVLSEAASLQSKGATSRQLRDSELIGIALVIVAISSLVYIYGDRAYRLIWFRLYKDYKLKGND